MKIAKFYIRENNTLYCSYLFENQNLQSQFNFAEMCREENDLNNHYFILPL